MILSKLISAIKCRSHNAIDKYRTKVVSLEVSELFFQHNGGLDFNRYDMIVRLLAVECYFGKNDYGFDFYRRMQAARINKEWVEPAVERFKSLIQSYDKNGYDEKSRILLDKNLHLVDGSHRMAMAMYYNIPRINASVYPKAFDIFYGIEWFKVNGFTKEECDILHNKYEKLKEQYSTPFICSIFSPVFNYYDEITGKLKLFGEVKEIRDYDFNAWDYKFYTRGIFHFNDKENWEIEKEIDYMMKSSPCSHKIRMVSLLLNQPNFKLKDKSVTTHSHHSELIKKLIRDAYKDKVSYFFCDSILNIGDNFTQNRNIYRLLTMPPVDLATIFTHIMERKYVVAKYDVPYMPNDFPMHYPLGKDIDIICHDLNEYKLVLESILNDLEQYKEYYNVRIVKKKDKDGKEYSTLVRLEQEDQYLVLMFDVTTRHRAGSTAGFIEEMVSTRQERDLFYIPQMKYELIIRLQELYEHPKKTHHKDYVTQHIVDLDEQLCKKHLKFNWKKIIK